MAEPIVQAVDVTKTYETGRVEVHALRGVDLSIEPGEMVAIIGPSGCGKTTLLNVLSGLDDLTAGEAFIDGEPLQTHVGPRAHALPRRAHGVRVPVLQPAARALRRRERRAAPAGRRGQAARRPGPRAREALALVGLAGEEDKRPAELSGGQQQRVSIARALVNQPAIVWGDEPTGSLDSENSADVMELLRSLNRRTRADLRAGHPRPDRGGGHRPHHPDA